MAVVTAFGLLALASLFISSECDAYGKRAIAKGFDLMTWLFAGVAIGWLLGEALL